MKTKTIRDLLQRNVEKVMVGCSVPIDLLWMCLLVNGHVLLEDVPGTGKTTLAKTMAKSLDLSFQRIQFTPDIVPSDVIGINVYHQATGTFEFKKGAIFSHLILADEINRATPRTQSALLEAMEERQVTSDMKTYALDEPFFVMATQNPIESTGTFPLPEAQIDRFMVRMSLGYPTLDEEVKMLLNHSSHNALAEVEAICTKEDILACKKECEEVKIHQDVVEYIVRLAKATRNHPQIAMGVSPRAALGMVKCSKAYAAIQGRNYVLPDDVKTLVPYVFGHRIQTNHYSFTQDNDVQKILKGILQEVAVPTEDLQ